MATNTPHYGFKKPGYTDPVDINDINGNFDKVDEELKAQSDKVGNLSGKLKVNFVAKGGKVNDNTYNSMTLLQSLTDELYALGGGIIEFPKGAFYFKGTYTAKSGVIIEGLIDNPTWNGNASLGTDKGTVFYHVPDVANTDFIELDQTNLVVGYVGNINIKNIYIIGSENSNVGLKVEKATVSSFENILIKGFNTNIQLNTVMNITFKNITSQQARSYCLHVTGGLSTSATFNKPYFGQTVDYPNSIPIKVDVYTIIGLYFIDPIIESTEKGVSIDSANTVSFINVYTENVPATSTAPTFDIGMSAPPSTYNGATNFNGGIIMGTNGTIIDGMTIFNTNYTHSFTVNGVVLQRSRNVILPTVNSKGVSFIGCNEVSITNNIQACNTLKNIAYINCTASSTTLTQKTFIPLESSIAVTLQNGWTIYTTGVSYSKSISDMVKLEFSATAGTIAAGTVIATLPVGYRPKTHVMIPLFNLSTVKFTGDYLRIGSNGNITVTDATVLTSGQVYQGDIAFYAGN